MCAECHPRWVAREFCPICDKLWAEPSDTEPVPEQMVQCEVCELWVHGDCEGVTTKAQFRQLESSHYACPECRKQTPATA